MAREPIPLSVKALEQIPPEDRSNVGLTTTLVFEQLKEILAATDASSAEPICDAVLTTVGNLELDVNNLRNATVEVYSRLMNLETRIFKAGVHLEDSDLNLHIKFG